MNVLLDGHFVPLRLINTERHFKVRAGTYRTMGKMVQPVAGVSWFRTIFWCYSLNEPVMLDNGVCPCCKWVFDGRCFSEPFKYDHFLIGKIQQPGTIVGETVYIKKDIADVWLKELENAPERYIDCVKTERLLWLDCFSLLDLNLAEVRELLRGRSDESGAVSW